jgi:hypothetical protein
VTDKLALIRRIYEEFARGEMATMNEHLAPDARFVNPPYAVEGGIRTSGRVSRRHRAFFDMSRVDDPGGDDRLVRMVQQLRRGLRSIQETESRVESAAAIAA